MTEPKRFDGVAASASEWRTGRSPVGPSENFSLTTPVAGCALVAQLRRASLPWRGERATYREIFIEPERLASTHSLALAATRQATPMRNET